MKAAIIDDMVSDAEKLSEFLNNWAGKMETRLALLDWYESGEAFLQNFDLRKYDVIFIDIYMEGITGMETARRIRNIEKSCCLIFTTNTPDYGAESYEVNAAYYLVKPYCYEQLAQAMARCGKAVFRKEGVLAALENRQVFIDEIAYTECYNRKINVHMRNGEQVELNISQSELTGKLSAYPNFCDCMRGILINFEAVEKLLEDSFHLIGGGTVPISRLKYGEVRRKFLDYTYHRTRGGK